MANGDIGNKIDDALSYPILTEEVRLPAATRPGDGGGGSSQSAQTVESTLRNILGWRVRDNDPKSFVAALTKSFASSESQGHTEWKWTPHTYSIEANMGAVTGAQAAIYSRATVALNQALPLLDGLQTLLAASDAQEVEATSAIVRSSITELVNELGREGGPRVARVDEYFSLLLGDNPDQLNSENVGGQLGALRDTFGLRRQNVNTIGEEQNLTNFLILVDDINALGLTWASQKSFFERNSTNVFLGTQLVLLGRTLAVVSESVQEAYFAMDSVFLGPAERQVTSLDLGSGSPVFLGELLEWVDHFAVTEGPRLISEGGKNGVIKAFTPTVEKLADLIGQAADLSAGDGANPSPAFHSPRVARSLADLQTQLDTTVLLAGQIKREPPPEVTYVDPEGAETSGLVRLTINGKDFQDGAGVVLRPAIEDNDEINAEPDVVFIDEAEMKATFNLKGVARGKYSVVVTNPDGQTGELDEAFTVTVPEGPPGLDIKGVKPLELLNEPDQRVTVRANNFDPDTAIVSLEIGTSPVTIKQGVPTTSTRKKLRALFDLHDISPTTGVKVFVQQPPDQAVLAPNTVNIVAGPAVIVSFAPSSLRIATDQRLTITGRNFDPGVSVSLVIQATSIPGRIRNATDKLIDVSFDLSKVPASAVANVSVKNPGEDAVEAVDLHIDKPVGK